MKTWRFYLAIIFLGAFTAIGFVQSVNASNYGWLQDSLEPVSNCQWVHGAIAETTVYINLYCPEHNEYGGLVRVKKSLFIDLVTKWWARYGWRFELLD